MSIPLAMIGAAMLEVIGFNPNAIEYASEATWASQAVFDDELFWQPTAMGERSLTIRLATRPHVTGGMAAYEILKAHHEARDIVPFIRLTGGWSAEMIGDVGIRRISHSESKIAPGGIGYRHEFEAGLILVGRAAGGFF